MLREQRAAFLSDARHIWSRFVENTRFEVQEKADLLVLISNLSALIAGFAVIGIVEFQFDQSVVPVWLVGLYSSTTAVTVGSASISMVLCAYLAASVLRTAQRFTSATAESSYIADCYAFYEAYQPGDLPPTPAQSFHHVWVHRFAEEWTFAFRLFRISIFTFIAMVSFAAPIKVRQVPKMGGG